MSTDQYTMHYNEQTASALTCQATNRRIYPLATQISSAYSILHVLLCTHILHFLLNVV